jgi:5,10-methylene-tetrahydrofolate dehydrogenase/methenyl tetrahydrofolate cyclohydrolase
MRKLAEVGLGGTRLIDTSGTLRVAVIGLGVVGTTLRDELKCMGYNPFQVTRKDSEERPDEVAEQLRRQDVIFTVAGARTVGPEHVHRGSIVIDAGVRRVEGDQARSSWVYSGDVDPEVYEIDGVIVTPRLRAVGLLTGATIAENTATVGAWEAMRLPSQLAARRVGRLAVA